MSLFEKQKLVKPKPEDVAGDFLDNERAAAMQNLVAFIREKRINIGWGSTNSWALKYKGKQLGYLKIYEHHKPVPAFVGTWFFCHRRDFLDRYYDMENCALKTFIFKNIYARACERRNCFAANPDPNALATGYTNPARCGCWPLRVYNPDGEALEYTKRLIEYRMDCILADSK